MIYVNIYQLEMTYGEHMWHIVNIFCPKLIYGALFTVNISELEMIYSEVMWDLINTGDTPTSYSEYRWYVINISKRCWIYL